MRILVTGGAGFIGSHVVDALIQKGHQVSVIDDLSAGNRNNLNPEANFYKRNITDDISDIFGKTKPEVVFHLAAQIDLRKSINNPISDANTNILGTLNILENMRKFKSRKIISSSTAAVYSNDVKIPTSEIEEEQPSSPYGIAKLSIEKYLQFYKKVHGIDFVSLRYSNVYGSRQNSKGEAGVIAIFIDKILSGDQPIINGSGKQTRDYVYVKDVVKANMLAFEKNTNGIFNVSTGIETNVNELFRKIVELLGKPIKEVHGPVKPGEQVRSCLSYNKIKKELEWESEWKIEDGLRKTVEWFKRKHQKS